MANRQAPLRIFAGLSKAIAWYDVSLQSMLAELGMEPVNRTQSMILVHISRGITRPSEIAREMGTTRQNIHAMAKQLIENKVVKQIPDPEDGRSKLYSFSDETQELRETVLEILRYLDQELAKRIGKDSVNQLQSSLGAGWGDYITSPPTKLIQR